MSTDHVFNHYPDRYLEFDSDPDPTVDVNSPRPQHIKKHRFLAPINTAEFLSFGQFLRYSPSKVSWLLILMKDFEHLTHTDAYHTFSEACVGNYFVSLYREPHSIDVAFSRRRRRTSLTQIVSQINEISVMKSSSKESVTNKNIGESVLKANTTPPLSGRRRPVRSARRGRSQTD
ncbi:hypothetical protein EVAR_39747_1 [Eumeta japonica]|uniref:Uncharacterized protein n=1 Tax=Eumeta variegata TaxID=151549 RepID=A0A4C1X2U3_EUMVA|nr:hypothetical protein EVAR_39747_1 [Eumeta japonica]